MTSHLFLFQQDQAHDRDVDGVPNAGVMEQAGHLPKGWGGQAVPWQWDTCSAPSKMCTCVHMQEQHTCTHGTCASPTQHWGTWS